MRRAVIGSVLVAVLVVGAALFAPRLAGQELARRAAAAQAYVAGSGASIGVTVRDLSSEEIARAALPRPGGVRIEQVRPQTPAAAAGFQTGDIVVEFDGERVRSSREFARLVQETPPGRTVAASVVRGSDRLTLDVTPDVSGPVVLSLPLLRQDLDRGLDALPHGFTFNVDPRWSGAAPSTGRLGATVLPLDEQLARHFGVTAGVLVSSVAPNTPAAQAGLRAGDVITAVGGRSVLTPSDLDRQVRQSAAGSTVELRVTRDRQETTLVVTIGCDRAAGPCVPVADPSAPGSPPQLSL